MAAGTTTTHPRSLPPSLRVTREERAQARAALDALAAAERALAVAVADVAACEKPDIACGYANPVRMVAHSTDSSNRAALPTAAAITFCREHPAARIALAEGRVSIDKVAALAAACRKVDADLVLRDLGELLDEASSRSVERFAERCWMWRRRVAPDLDREESERSYEQRSMTLQFGLDGSCNGNFRLDPIGAAIVTEAIETNVRPDPMNGLEPPRTLAQRRADALVDLAADSLHDPFTPTEPAEANGDSGSAGHSGSDDNGDTPAPARTTSPLSLPTGARMGGGARADVVIDLPTLAGLTDVPLASMRMELARTGAVPSAVIEQLLCDASFAALITDGPKVILAYGEATPDIPPALRRSVQRRDHNCGFPGCDRHWAWCDVHHILPRNKGGPTDLDNLMLLCRFHHTLVHQGGWTITFDPLTGHVTATAP